MFNPTRRTAFSDPFIVGLVQHRLPSVVLHSSSCSRLNEYCVSLFSEKKFFSTQQEMPIGAPKFVELNSPDHLRLIENLKKEKVFLTKDDLEEIRVIIEEKDKIESTPYLKKTIPRLLASSSIEERLRKLEAAVFKEKEYKLG